MGLPPSEAVPVTMTAVHAWFSWLSVEEGSNLRLAISGTKSKKAIAMIDIFLIFST